MRYTEEAYYKAEKELERRRISAQEEQKKRLADISRGQFELIELERKITNVNLELLKVISRRDPDVKASDCVMKIKENNLKAHQEKEALLKKMGYPTDYLDVKYHCQKCFDSGYSDGKRCECFKELLEEYSYEDRAKGCEFELHDFDEFKLEYYPSNGEPDDPYNSMKKVLNNCIEYSRDFSDSSDSLLFIGNTGLGKTMLSSCIAKRVLLNGYSVVFKSVFKILEDVLAEHYGKKTGNTLEELRDTDLVILDDLGSEFSDQSDPILYQIINDRINLHKPTVVTTNMTPQQLNERYNERIFSRLFGEYKVYPFVGNDIRFEKNNI